MTTLSIANRDMLYSLSCYMSARQTALRAALSFRPPLPVCNDEAAWSVGTVRCHQTIRILEPSNARKCKFWRSQLTRPPPMQNVSFRATRFVAWISQMRSS
jgi:hypothetical protein